MQQNSIEPFQIFFKKINNDLASWLQIERNLQQLVDDYKNTLTFIEQSFNSKKLMVQLGHLCQAKAKRVNEMIVIRCKQDLYVEFTKVEAVPVVKALIQLHQDKIKVCRAEICKIMGSMRQVQTLINSYQKLM